MDSPPLAHRHAFVVYESALGGAAEVEEFAGALDDVGQFRFGAGELGDFLGGLRDGVDADVGGRRSQSIGDGRKLFAGSEGTGAPR